MVSIQPLLAKLQEHIISIEAVPMRREMLQPEHKQPDRIHFLMALCLQQSQKLPTACAPVGQEVLDPRFTGNPPSSVPLAKEHSVSFLAEFS